MNNSIYISANNSDMFDIDIRANNSGAHTASMQSPDNVSLPSEFEVVANKSLLSFGVMLICIILFLIFILLFKRKKTQETTYSSSKEYKRTRSQYIQEDSQSQDTMNESNNIYRNSGKRRSSLSTPSSINKCIRAFLENTKEN